MLVLWVILLPWLAWSSVYASNGEFEPGSVIIGIDLGTTYSCVGVLIGNRVEIIVNEEGDRLTPSWVTFGESDIRVGNAAKKSAHLLPEQSIFAVKQFFGRSYNNPELAQDMKLWPFKIVYQNGKPFVRVTTDGKSDLFSPEEISSVILIRLKETAEDYLGKKVTHDVLAIPAYFNDAQRQATKEGGITAGLNIVRIINEPTAAAIAYGLDKKSRRSHFAVYDLGGGTLDVSLLLVQDSGFEVLATSGDTHLGGEDFNNRVVNYLAHEYQLKTGYEVLQNPRALLKLHSGVEQAKRRLSTQIMTTIEIEAFENGNDYLETLTHAKFESRNFDLFLRALEPLSQVLEDAKLNMSDFSNLTVRQSGTRLNRESLFRIMGRGGACLYQLHFRQSPTDANKPITYKAWTSIAINTKRQLPYMTCTPASGTLK
ncbi:ATPase with role in protein import into the ER [Ceratobasidium sp. 392]|nr:ATPase with role in protein import into the ER [Ceratobasidium sp. 392]